MGVFPNYSGFTLQKILIIYVSTYYIHNHLKDDTYCFEIYKKYK